MAPRRSKRLAARAASNGIPEPLEAIQIKPKRKATTISRFAAQPRSLLIELSTELLDFISQAVLEIIVKGKRFSDHPRDLIRLGQTCRRLFCVTQHALYRQIIAGKTQHGAARFLDLSKLICSLWSNINLGPLVRHICLDPFHAPRCPGKRLLREQLVHGNVYQNRTCIGSAMKHFLGVEMNNFSPCIGACIGEWCQESALPVFVLFAMAPNLTSAQLTIPEEWAIDGAFRTLPDGTRVPTVAFPSLTNLQLRFGWSDYEWPSGSWRTVIGALLLATPNLTSLELNGFSGLSSGLLSLPSQLRSFILIDTYVSDGALRCFADNCKQLSKLCTYSYHNGAGDHEVEHLTGERLRVLSSTKLADKLQTLALCSTVLHPNPITVMGRFTALKVLGIRYAFNGNKGFDKDLLVNLVKDCPHLRGLFVAGAFRITPKGLKQFAMAVSRLEFPSLRQVKLVCRSEFWGALQQVAKNPVPGLFRFGNVKLVLQVHEYEGTAQLVEEMERDVL